MKTCLLANDRSGSWGQCEVELKRLAGQSGTPILRESPDCSINQVIDTARRERCERLIVAGGDGSLSRFVSACAPNFDDFELALIPTGTGNDLARSLGIHGESWADAWNLALSRPAVPIDLIRVTNGKTHYVINAATAGFGGVVSTDVTDDDKHRWGAVAYWMTAFAHLATLKEFDVRLEFDTEMVSLRTFGLAIANGRYVGGGFPVSPTAIVNDGLLDVTTVPVLPALELIAAGVDFAFGRHLQTERVKTYRSTRVRIHAEPVLPYSLDGEPSQGIDATFEVLPNAVRIACGPTATALRSNLPERQIDDLIGRTAARTP